MENLRIRLPAQHARGLNFTQTHNLPPTMPPPGVVPRPPPGLPPGRRAITEAKIATVNPTVRRVLGKKKEREPSPPAPVERRVLKSKKPKTETKEPEKKSESKKVVRKHGEKGMSYDEYIDRHNSVMEMADERPYTKKEYTAKFG